MLEDYASPIIPDPSFAYSLREGDTQNCASNEGGIAYSEGYSILGEHLRKGHAYWISMLFEAADV